MSKNRDHRWFEKWARAENMKPVMKVTDPTADILIADSGTAFADNDGERIYRTGWSMQRGVAKLNYKEDFFAYARPELTLSGYQNLRVNMLLDHARETIRILDENDEDQTLRLN